MVQRFHLLSTAIDLDGLYDILEMKVVESSWSDAAWLNGKEPQ
jgi:hypothetical protein